MSGPDAVAAFMFFGGAFWVPRPPEMDREERGEILTELQQVRHEVAELAERMDFAERLLAKPREAPGARD